MMVWSGFWQRWWRFWRCAGWLLGAQSSALHYTMCLLALPHCCVACLAAEAYVTEKVKDRAVVTWNMELDTLRSDLGEWALGRDWVGG